MARSVLRHATLAALLVFSAAGVASVPAFAQDGISARIEAESARRLKAEEDAASVRQTGPGVITEPLNRRDLPPPGGPTLMLASVSFSPASAFLTGAELDAIKAGYVGRSVDFSQLSKLVRDVNDLYAEKGVVTAAAVLGPQDLGDGKLVITLVEGQLGAVAFTGERQTKTKFILDRIRMAQGTTVDVPTAARDIAYFNQTNQAQLRLLLQPGAAFGLTDLVYGVTEPAPHQLQFFFDNNGVESTGELRASVLYRRYGLLGIDDTFLAYIEKSRGSRSATVRADAPFTPGGTRLAFSGTISRYSVVSGPTAGLDLSGKAHSASVTVTQPLIATDRFVLQATAAAFKGSSWSYSAGVPLVDVRTTKRSVGLLLGSYGDNWRFDSQVQAVSATVDDTIAANSTRYSVTTGSFDGTYRLNNGMAFIGRGAWQSTHEVLLPGELLFQIGGPTTVRGYPSDGVAGDSGFYANFELHKAFQVKDKQVNGFAFLDVGEVHSSFPSVTSLASVGLGTSYAFSENGRFDLVVGVPIKNALASQSDATLSATLTLARF
ncbi:ShlB/FhaC/HecB family hemolysin secretion/activation protein [Pseudorhodobacter turbinis]|nr:ShlB/FhaC/HecB family hemolysin secretion/activation protein [Pseudorhodobacter turbinis]